MNLQPKKNLKNSSQVDSFDFYNHYLQTNKGFFLFQSQSRNFTIQRSIDVALLCASQWDQMCDFQKTELHFRKKKIKVK